MKSTTAYSSALLAALASTALATNNQRFALVATPKDHPKEEHKVKAWDQSFYYYQPNNAGVYNKTACSYDEKDMTKQTQFSFDFDTSSNPGGYLDLEVLKPEGQQVYVDSSDGALKYKDKTDHTPPDPILGPFNFTGKPTDHSPHGHLQVPGCDVIACPEGKTYKLFAKEQYHKTHPAPKYGDKPLPDCKDVDLITVCAEGQCVYEYASAATYQPSPPKYKPSRVIR